MAELELHNLVKIYPYAKPKGLFDRRRARLAKERERQSPYTTNEGIIALQQVSLEVEHGEFVVFLGASGCGKSTLLRMIAGLEDISAGEVRMDGIVVNDLPPEQRDVAMVFQNYSLYPHLCVYDNIAFTLKNKHVPRAELDKKVMAAAEILNLTDLLDRMPKELSGGQQQRVAIARAIIREPKLFLVDEPFSNLDAGLRGYLREEIRKLYRRLGTTFLYVTHDQMEAMTLGTKIVVMRHGMIEQVGTPRDLYNRPANRYVASLIGAPQMNFMENQKLQRDNSGWYIDLFGQRVSLSPDKCEHLSEMDDGHMVALGIRPVDVQLAPVGIPAQVTYVEHLGSEINVHMKVQNCSFSAVLSQNSPYAANLMKGQQIHVQIPANRIHLFSQSTQKRVM